ncbi:GNAT family N-acetyltransferase [Apilactobacillus apisilvae]|uniref:GNAT family N-acetyltransferase n=1 Tax=Apilactobacillus apisilvae TaxID=2923364 RepID=A0ABY4PHM2_9LACO|nr:GNAT family N-acetyltransferase [Apilactobacillus apisilvae]UQS85097.1 GNAT family N-acetyltransferase [Apilactobacillus apisilvae]
MQENFEVQLSLAIPDDASKLIDLLTQLKQESDTFTIDPELGDMTVKQQSKQIMLVNQTRGNVIIVAKYLDTIIGLVTVQELDNSGCGELGVAVLKQYWNCGLGTKLVMESINWGINYSNLSEIALIVKKNNKPAIHVYEKCGFNFSKHRLINIQENYHSTYEMQIKVKK